MQLLEQLADTLAIETLEAAEKTGDEDMPKKIAAAIASSSTTMEEAYLTAVRVRRAERRARALIEQLIAAGPVSAPE